MAVRIFGKFWVSYCTDGAEIWHKFQGYYSVFSRLEFGMNSKEISFTCLLKFVFVVECNLSDDLISKKLPSQKNRFSPTLGVFPGSI